MTSIKITEEASPKPSIDDLLRLGIRNGSYVPSQRLVEIDLMNQLGGSQRQVRAALQRLELEGLVKIEKNRGATVRKVTHEEVSCIFDLLDSLSLLAIRKISENILDINVKSTIKESLKVARTFRESSATELRLKKYHEENIRFWDSIASVVKNPFLWETRERLQSLLYCFQGHGLTINSNPNNWIDHHEEILEAILDNDPDLACKLLIEANTKIREAVLQLDESVFR